MRSPPRSPLAFRQAPRSPWLAVALPLGRAGISAQVFSTSASPAACLSRRICPLPDGEREGPRVRRRRGRAQRRAREGAGHPPNRALSEGRQVCRLCCPCGSQGLFYLSPLSFSVSSAGHGLRGQVEDKKGRKGLWRNLAPNSLDFAHEMEEAGYLPNLCKARITCPALWSSCPVALLWP